MKEEKLKQHPILLIHGLNNKTSILNDLKNSLESMGYQVTVLTLKGHEGEKGSKIKSAKSTDWINDFAEVWYKIKKSSINSKQKINIIAYSLGAVVTENFFLKHRQEAQWVESATYFAPAFFIKNSSKLFVRTLELLQLKFMVSVTPKEYRANRFLPVSAYKALFELADNFKAALLDDKNFITFKRQIFMSKHDELVNFSQTKKYANDHHIAFQELKKAKDAKYKYQHLIITIDDLGFNQWNEILLKSSELLTSRE